MKKRMPLIIGVAVVAFLLWALMSRPVAPPRAPEPPDQIAVDDLGPLAHPMLVHMIEAGAISLEGPEADLIVTEKANGVNIQMTPHFFQKFGQGAELDLRMPGGQATLTADAYDRFLDALHDMTIQQHPDLHHHESTSHEHTAR